MASTACTTRWLALAMITFSSASRAQPVSVNALPFVTSSSTFVDVPGSDLSFSTLATESWLIFFTARVTPAGSGDPSAELVVEDLGGTPWAATSAVGPDSPVWTTFDFVSGAKSSFTLHARLRSAVAGTATLQFYRAYAFKLNGVTTYVEPGIVSLVDETAWRPIASLAIPNVPCFALAAVNASDATAAGVAVRLSIQGVSYPPPLPGLGDRGFFLHHGASTQTFFAFAPISAGGGTVRLEARASPLLDGGRGTPSNVPLEKARIVLVPMALFPPASLALTTQPQATTTASTGLEARAAVDAGAGYFVITNQLVTTGAGGIRTLVNGAEVSRDAVTTLPGTHTIGYLDYITAGAGTLALSTQIFGVNGGTTSSSAQFAAIFGRGTPADGGSGDGGSGDGDAGLPDSGVADAGGQFRQVVVDLGCGCRSGGAPAVGLLLLGLLRPQLRPSPRHRASSRARAASKGREQTGPLLRNDASSFATASSRCLIAAAFCALVSGWSEFMVRGNASCGPSRRAVSEPQPPTARASRSRRASRPSGGGCCPPSPGR